MSKNRLLNKLFEDPEFLVDRESVPYIVRDIINMNWWNTCGYLLGYQKNKRISLKPPTKRMKLIGLILKEFYRHRQEKVKNVPALEKELRGYIEGKTKQLRQLKLFSMQYRRNDSQYFYKDGKSTWLDCTSRATYAWKYVAQNGYIDFDGVCRVKDGEKIIEHCKNDTIYPNREELLGLFASGENQVKTEIFSQKSCQNTVEDWVDVLGINVLDDRMWLYDEIKHVKTDPYKNNEKRLLKEGKLTGNNELLYGLETAYSIKSKCASSASRASDAGHVSHASHASSVSDASHESSASNVSNASSVSGASRASNANRASNVSSASDVSSASQASDAGVTGRQEKNAQSWFDVPTAIGPLAGLDHPPVFKRNKYGLAGHWKINKELVESCNLGWFEPFLGHGESPIFAKRLRKNFVGIEINPDSMNGYLLPYVQKSVNEAGDTNAKVELRLGDSSVFQPDLVNKFDLCYTSPPYFDFEDYGFHNKVVQECIDYDEYHERVTVPVFLNVRKYLIPGGILAIQTEKNKTLKNKWIEVLESVGFTLLEDTITGQEAAKYSKLSKRDQTLLIFVNTKKEKK